MAKNFNTSLARLAEYDAMGRALFTEKAPVCVSGLSESAAVHFSLELGTSDGAPHRIFYITYNEVRAREIADDAAAFGSRVPLLYPARDLLFAGADVRGSLLSRQRVTALRALVEEKDALVVTTIDALLCRLISPLHLSESIVRLKPGDIMEPNVLIKKLVALGYERESITSKTLSRPSAPSQPGTWGKSSCPKCGCYRCHNSGKAALPHSDRKVPHRQ